MRGFEQIPWLYDTLFDFFDWRGMGKWRLWLAKGARGRTLEVGCGTGRNLPLYPQGVQLTGIEPSPDTLARASKRSPGTPLVRASAEALPFRDNSFDTVVASLVFCSVDQPDVGLAEIRRVLRDNGTLRMIEHVREKKRWRARLQDFIQPAWTWAAGGCRNNRDTETTVQAAGFEIEPDGRREVDTFRRFAAHKQAR